MSIVPVTKASARPPASAHNSFLLAGFSTLMVVGSTSGQLTDFYQQPAIHQPAISSSSVAPAAEPPHFVSSLVVHAGEVPSAARSTAQSLTEAHEASGLTWQQIARYFGVSRRAVHLWASGGRMAASNAELLAHLVRAVDEVKHLAPDDRRQVLLRSDNGLNIVDTERAARSSRATDINRSPEIGVTGEQA